MERTHIRVPVYEMRCPTCGGMFTHLNSWGPADARPQEGDVIFDPACGGLFEIVPDGLRPWGEQET